MFLGHHLGAKYEELCSDDESSKLGGLLMATLFLGPLGPSKRKYLLTAGYFFNQQEQSSLQRDIFYRASLLKIARGAKLHTSRCIHGAKLHMSVAHISQAKRRHSNK
jgi:hypothetical protein